MPRFVIQQHDATARHFDLRLEVDGVYRSWAVPKGPSTDPRDKRLAIEVEDHSLGWGAFEGVTPSARGSGAVIVWDRGTYRNLDDRCSMRDALAAGHASFWLDGQKLRGGWTLHLTPVRGRPKWLLVKRRDEEADSGHDVTATRPKSVRSGRTIEQVAAEG